MTTWAKVDQEIPDWLIDGPLHLPIIFHGAYEVKCDQSRSMGPFQFLNFSTIHKSGFFMRAPFIGKVTLIVY